MEKFLFLSHRRRKVHIIRVSLIKENSTIKCKKENKCLNTHKNLRRNLRNIKLKSWENIRIDLMLMVIKFQICNGVMKEI
jgi:hypothetical protein